MLVRSVRPFDAGAWTRMRISLWPDAAADAAGEVRSFFHDGCIDRVPHGVFVAVSDVDPRRLIGFVEVSMREAVPGSASRRAGFVEGWFVEREWRRQGVGRALLREAEAWAMVRGATEMGSDTDTQHSDLSVPAHVCCGFARVLSSVEPEHGSVKFVKPLEPS